MIIEGTKYNGKCSCGREHFMTTKLCVIENGCLLQIEEYFKKFDLIGKKVAIYDENTYLATSDRHPKSDYEIILPPDNLHANETGSDLLLSKLPADADVLIAIGSGTIHDLTRYCAYKTGKEFVSCPTAASVDGFCSSVAAMTWHGCKKTLTAKAPLFVLADIDIIKNAPKRLTKSGFGDMIGKFVALADWKIGQILLDEFFCDTIADMTFVATKKVLESAEGILSKNDEAYKNLMYGLLLSGLAMQMLGYSRPASGAEHHISHIIEMNPPLILTKSDALHGEKVGVGTLLAIAEYTELAKYNNPKFYDYTAFDTDELENVFGRDTAKEILAENNDNCSANVTGCQIKKNWAKICDVINGLPNTEYLIRIYDKLGIKKTLSDIEVDERLKDNILKFSPAVRNRLTLMRIKECIRNG